MDKYAWIIVNNFFKFCILGTLYNAIIHKNRFLSILLQKNLFKSILDKFMSYFSEFYFISYKFWNSIRISRNYIEKGNQKKGKTSAQYRATFGP
jgi:hypothetical protein